MAALLSGQGYYPPPKYSDPKEAGEIAYMLANGSGKARANRNGHARSRHEWRLLFLSAGEIGLAQHMNEAGKKIKAGQAVRLVEVSTDANQGHGIFENLHEHDSGATLSKAITEGCQHFYGTPAVTFLEAITDSQNFEKLPTIIHELRQQFIATYSKGHNGQAGHQEEQKAKIRQLIYKISAHYGGDSPELLELYIQDVLHDWAHDLDSALACFQDVVSKLNPAGLRRKDEIRERNERATGVYMRVNEDCERVSDKEDRFSYKSQPEFCRKNTENQGENFHA